jgi:hypothetical protein
MKEKRLEFSKKILIVSYLAMFATTAVMAYIILVGADASSFLPVVLASWAEVTTVNAFYFWKARAENRLKILLSAPPEILDNLEIIRELFQ